MLRFCLASLIAFAAVCHADEIEKPNVEMTGSLEARGLPMAECDLDVFRIKLVAKVDDKGNGKGTLTLDSTPNVLDEFGQQMAVDSIPTVKLECTLKLIKSKKMLIEGGPGQKAREIEVQLIEITGPKIVSKITLTHEAGPNWHHAQFLWSTKEGKNRTAVALFGKVPQLQLQAPCHPGCFPAGTQVQTPKGERSIQNLRVGDEITTIGADGKESKAKITSMFLTKNRIVEIRIDGRKIMTTSSQPIALADGKLKAAGELKAGDQIQTWTKGEAKPAKVLAVEETLRDLPVYNVIVGDPTLFIANGIIARSKPPQKEAAVP